MIARLRRVVLVSGIVALSGMSIECAEEKKQAAQQEERKRSHAQPIRDAASSQSQTQSSPNSSPTTSPGSSPSDSRHRGSAGCMAYLMYESPDYRMSPTPRK